MTTLSPKEQLSSPEPKCGNCKFMARVGHRVGKPVSWYKSASGTRVDASEPFEPAPGKGACMEPGTVKYPEQKLRIFYVTDLMLCSQWAPKED